MSQRLALQYIEIDLDHCSLTYGVSPCAAVLGVVGTPANLIPAMTGATTSGVTVSGTNAVVANPYWLGADRVSGTFFQTDAGVAGGVGTWSVDFGQSRAIAGVSITARNDGGFANAPKAFTIQYSDNGSAWTTISSPAAQTGWTIGEKRTFTFDREHHRYWRLSLATNESLNGSIAFSECEVLQYPTGAEKCFNSKATCQDVPHFTNDPVILRFSVSTDYLPADIECVPAIKSISFDPATLSLGENLGQRATLTAVFIDHRDSDTGPGGDPYLVDRDYDPYSQGTYFGKFRARHPFVRGRGLRWITGFVGDDLADMVTRHFIIDSFTGPSPRGEFSLVAKDVLKLADGDRALAPLPSNGFLVADINDSVTSIVMSPAGIGDAEYPSGAPDYYVNIAGREIVLVTSRTADTLTVTREQLGTVAAAHKAQDRVQLVLRYAAADPADIIADLLETYAGVDGTYIPLTEWQNETATYLDSNYTATIANPTSVNTLISELIQQAALAVWWRDAEQTIGLQVLRGVDTTAFTFDESNVIADTLSIQDQPDKRVSQVLVYFAQKNPLTSLTDVANYGSLATVGDADAEADYGSAAIKTIHSRWIPIGGRAVAERAADLILSRFRDPPRKFGFSVLRGSNPVEPEMGQGFKIEGWPIQDAFGATTFAPIEITRVNAGPDIVVAEAEEMLFTAPVDEPPSVSFDFNTNNVNLRSSFDLLYDTPESGDTVNFYVQAGVIIGSANTSLPAMDVGSWPAGVTVNLFVHGRIQGAGGLGGSSTTTVGLTGLVGGPALYSRSAFTLDNTTGEIFGGAGGGGGGAGASPFDISNTGGAGGGGAGTVGGQPGSSNLEQGLPGTADAGGAGGPAHGGLGAGGAGGGPGLPGGTGTGGWPVAPAAAAGAAIDGDSFATVSATGDIRGSRIN